MVVNTIIMFMKKPEISGSS